MTSWTMCHDSLLISPLLISVSSSMRSFILIVSNSCFQTAFGDLCGVSCWSFRCHVHLLHAVARSKFIHLRHFPSSLPSLTFHLCVLNRQCKCTVVPFLLSAQLIFCFVGISWTCSLRPWRLSAINSSFMMILLSFQLQLPSESGGFVRFDPHSPIYLVPKRGLESNDE